MVSQLCSVAAHDNVSSLSNFMKHENDISCLILAFFSSYKYVWNKTWLLLLCFHDPFSIHTTWLTCMINLIKIIKCNQIIKIYKFQTPLEHRNSGYNSHPLVLSMVGEARVTVLWYFCALCIKHGCELYLWYCVYKIELLYNFEVLKIKMESYIQQYTSG